MVTRTRLTITPVALASTAIEDHRPQLIVTAFCGPAPALTAPTLAGPDHLHLSISDAGPHLSCVPATTADVARVLDWVRALPRSASVVFACLAGISRSSALALVAAEALGATASAAWSVLRGSRLGFAPNPAILAAAAALLDDAGRLADIRAEAVALPRPPDRMLGSPFSFEI